MKQKRRLNEVKSKREKIRVRKKKISEQEEGKYKWKIRKVQMQIRNGLITWHAASKELSCVWIKIKIAFVIGARSKKMQATNFGDGLLVPVLNYTVRAVRI